MDYAKIILSLLGPLYAVMRPILLKAVNDPDQEWDDMLMRIADALFGYKP